MKKSKPSKTVDQQPQQPGKRRPGRPRVHQPDPIHPQAGSEALAAFLGAMGEAESRGVTRYLMAMRTGISQAALSNLKSKRHGPQLATAAKVLAAAGYKIVIVRDKTLD